MKTYLMMLFMALLIEAHARFAINDDSSFQHEGSNQVVIGNSSTLVIAGKVGWSILSDARIKNTVNEDVKGLDFISRLRPVTYHISNAAITAVTGSKETPDFSENMMVKK